MSLLFSRFCNVVWLISPGCAVDVQWRICGRLSRCAGCLLCHPMLFLSRVAVQIASNARFEIEV